MVERGSPLVNRKTLFYRSFEVRVTRPIRRNVKTNELYGRVNDSCAVSGFSTGFDDIIARNIATGYSTGYFCRH